MENRLGGETSPYLLQHKENPVAWWPWGPQALAAAKESGRPILLSVGYAACHWCHVMAHESFEDETTARVMNELFICIKVDREERPDIDAIYQSALALLGEQGGWPLTMFLTPEGEPFWGGTYFPPTARYGRPSFIAVLEGIARIFREDGDKVASNVEALRQGLKQHFTGQAGGAVTPQLLDDVALRLMQEIDPAEGGLGGPPKFPNCAALQLIWRAFRRTGLAGYRQAIELTLEKMSLGGIYDHLGGGYARYAVDGIWLVPHFEKMLYDNALILSLLNLAHAASLNPLFDQRRRETIEWLLREMQAASGAPHLAENGQPAGEASGAFAASLDADSEGHEGKFYVWDEAEIDRLLGADAPTFKTIYDVTPEGNFEGKTILNRREHPPTGDAALEARLAKNRQTLRLVRDKRIWPGWDDKVLADWNGMTIAALCEAGAMAGEASWIAAATRALSFIREKMLRGGRLYHSWRHGRLLHLATLDDLAQVALGALSHFEVTGEKESLALAERLTEIALRHHLDKGAGGFFTTADDAEALILRAKTASDSATPSGNGVMVEVLARLFYLTGKDSYRQVAEATVAAFSGSLQRQFFSLASLLNGAEFLESARQIVVIGQRGQADTDALIQAVWRAGDPLRVLQVIAPGDVLHDGHPAKGKTQNQGRATAFVCRGAVCSLPLTDPATLSAALA